MKNPHSGEQGRETGMNKASHRNIRPSTLKIEDAVMILSIGVVLLLIITEACR